MFWSTNFSANAPDVKFHFLTYSNYFVLIAETLYKYPSIKVIKNELLIYPYTYTCNWSECRHCGVSLGEKYMRLVFA